MIVNPCRKPTRSACRRRMRLPMEWKVPPQMPSGALRQQRRDAIEHLPGGLVGESQEQDAARRDTLLEQPRHAISQSACLSAAGASDDERRARAAR